MVEKSEMPSGRLRMGRSFRKLELYGYQNTSIGALDVLKSTCAVVASSVFLRHPEARSRVHVEALPESGFRHGIYLISREREMPQMIERMAGFARKAAEIREG